MISSKFLCGGWLTGMVVLAAVPSMAGTIVLQADADIWMGVSHDRREDDGISVWASGYYASPRYGAVDFNLTPVTQPILGAYIQLYAPTSGVNSDLLIQQAYLLSPPGTAGLGWSTVGSRTWIALDSLGFYNLPAGSPQDQWYSSNLASAADVAKLEAIRTSANKNLTFLFTATAGIRDWDDKGGWEGNNPPRLVLITESSWNVADGDWDNPNNWDPVGVPGSGDVINIANGGVANAASYLRLGDTASQEGLLRVSNGTLNIAHFLQLGNRGKGTVVQTGGTVNCNESTMMAINMGGYCGGEGLYQISGGQLNVPNHNVWVGEWGKGVIIQTGGTVSIDHNLFLAYGQESGKPRSSGRYEISSGTLTVGGYVELGRIGDGVFVQTGGTVTINQVGSIALYVGSLAGSTGVYQMSGGVLELTNGSLVVGDNGTGTFIQRGGTVRITCSSYNPALGLAYGSNAQGTYRISGGTLEVSGNQMLVNGSGGRVGRFEVVGSSATISLYSYGQNGSSSTLGVAIDSGGVSRINLTAGGSFVSEATLDMDIAGGLALTATKSFEIMRTTGGSISGTPTLTDLEPGLPYTVANTGTVLTASWSGDGYGPVWDSYAVPSEIVMPGGADSGYLTILDTVPGRDVYVRLDVRDNAGPLDSTELEALAQYMREAGINVMTSHPFLTAPYDLLAIFRPTSATSYLAWDLTDYDAARQGVDGLVVVGLSVGVPEPNSALLLGLGLLGWWGLRRKWQ